MSTPLKYISLQEAAKLCKYSQEYLSLRARQGKLNAKKIKSRWVTTHGWLNEYIQSTAKEPVEYISLSQASKLCSYSTEYLGLRARQKKLKAKRIGNRWVTTTDWLLDYVHSVERLKENQKILPQPQRTHLSPFRVFQASVFVSFVIVFGLFSIGFGKDGWNFAAHEATGIAQDFVNGFASGRQRLIRNADNSFLVLSDNTWQGLKLGRAKFTLNLARPSLWATRFSGFAQGFDQGIASTSDAAQDISQNLRLKLSVNLASPIVAKDFLRNYGEWLGNQYGKLNEDIRQGITNDVESLVEGYKAVDTSVSQGIKKDLTTIVEMESEFARGVQRSFAFFGKTIAKGVEKIAGGIKARVARVSEEARPQPEPETMPEAGPQEEVPSQEAEPRAQEPASARGSASTQIVREVQVLNSAELALLKSQVAGILTWRGDIDSLKAITQKIQSSPPSFSAVNAPVYIGSSGVQVAGNVNATSIGAAIGGVQNFGIGLSATIGETNNSASKLTVNAESTFNSQTKHTAALLVGTSTLTNFSIDTSGNLETKGSVEVLNSSDVAQITLATNGNITATGTLTAAGATITGTTTLSGLMVTGNSVLGDEGGDTLTFNASTLSLPNSLNIDSATLYIDASNNRIGVGTTSPSTPQETLRPREP